MSAYKYEVVTDDGSIVTGIIDAKDATEAVIKLKENCSVVNSLQEMREAAELGKISRTKKVKEKNLSMVCKQFAIILNSGLPVIRTIELIAAQTTDKTLKAILFDVAEDVKAGADMANSFSERGPKLPVTFIETIRAGEETGRLDAAFEKLSGYFEGKSKMKSKVVSSLTYPAFVVVVAVVVVAIIMIKAVPMFTTSFIEMGITLPLPTKILIGMSDFMRTYFFIFAVLIAAAVIFISIFKKTEDGGDIIGRLILKIPLIGKIQLMDGASQFANTLSTMLDAGLPVIRALNITGNTMTNRYLGNGIKSVAEGVESGHGIGATLKHDDRMPTMLIEMTSVGEETGSLVETLETVGAYYDNEVEQATTRMVGLLEPIIICVLAVLVCLILLAVYMPMFSLYGGMSTSI